MAEILQIAPFLRSGSFHFPLLQARGEEDAQVLLEPRAQREAFSEAGHDRYPGRRRAQGQEGRRPQGSLLWAASSNW